MGYGTLPYVGSGTLTPAFDSIIFLEANDRQQSIACISDGTIGQPLWVYWSPAPAVWAEALASPDPNDFPTFYMLGEDANPVRAVLESPVLHAQAGFEYAIAGLWIDFMIRPALMDEHDGGLGDFMLGFSAQIIGWGIPGVTDEGGDALTTSVVSSDVQSVSIDPATVSVDPWPHHRSVRLPCRIDGAVRSYRITLTDIVGIEFESVVPVGVMRDLRKG